MPFFFRSCEHFFLRIWPRLVKNSWLRKLHVVGSLGAMENMSEKSGCASAYELYRRTPVADLLSRAEFDNFWRCISDTERRQFLAQFRSGEPTLTREVYVAHSGYQAVMNGHARPEIKAIVEATINDLDLSYWAK